MTRTGCELGESILGALDSKGISGGAREHLRDCASCRDVVATDGWMKSYAAEPLEDRPLPGAALIWVTHDVMRSTSRFASFSRTAGRLETAGVALLALGWSLLFAWKWDALALLLQARPSTDVVQSLMNMQLFTVPFLTTVTALVCGSIVMTFRDVLIDDH